MTSTATNVLRSSSPPPNSRHLRPLLPNATLPILRNLRLGELGECFPPPSGPTSRDGEWRYLPSRPSDDVVEVAEDIGKTIRAVGFGSGRTVRFLVTGAGGATRGHVVWAFSGDVSGALNRGAIWR